MNFKILILILISLFSIEIKAQWFKLPDPQIYITNSPWSYSLVKISPVSNGNILYISKRNFYSNASGTDFFIYESKDDLNSSQIKYSISGYVSINGFAGSNGSACLFQLNNSGWNYLKYTPDNFITNTSVSLCGNGNWPDNPFRSYIVTPSYIYTTTQQYAVDTLILNRTSTANLFQPVCKKLPLYDGIVSNIDFKNDSIGFILCNYKGNASKKVIIKTIDFGTTWSEILIDSISGIKSFHFPSVNTGYVLKNDGSLLRTIDGGSTWTAANTNTATQLNCIGFTNDSVGYIGGASGLLIKTIDRGNSWNTELSNTSNPITSIYAYKNDTVYFQDSTNALYKNTPLIILPITPFHVSIIKSQSIVCPGDPVTLTASGADIYQWSANVPGPSALNVTVHPLSNTTYTLTGRKYGSAYSDTETVTIAVHLVAPIASNPASAEICLNSDDSITFTGTNSSQYVWMTDSGLINSPSITVNSNTTKSYTVVGTDLNGCHDTTTAELNVIPCNEFVFFPNPSSTKINIKSFSEPIKELNVFNLLGENVYHAKIESYNIELDVNNFTEGIYLMSITTENYKKLEKIFIKR